MKAFIDENTTSSLVDNNIELVQKDINFKSVFLYNVDLTTTDVDNIHRCVENCEIINFELENCSLNSGDLIYIISGFNMYKYIKKIKIYENKTKDKDDKLNYVDCFKNFNGDLIIDELSLNLSELNLDECLETIRSIKIQTIIYFNLLVKLEFEEIDNLCYILSNFYQRMKKIKNISIKIKIEKYSILYNNLRKSKENMMEYLHFQKLSCEKEIKIREKYNININIIH